MTAESIRYQDLSQEQQVQRVRDAWFTSGSAPGVEPGWPLYVYTDRMIVEHTEGLFSVPYAISEDGAITFGDPVEVQQEFVPARHPAASQQQTPDRRGLADVAQDFVRATARLFGLGEAAHAEAPQTEPPTTTVPDEGWLLQVPLRVYSDDDEERYVGGLVLTPGEDNAYGDIWEARDIRIMAHRFMENSQHIDYMHTTKVVAVPVESYYFPTEEEGGQKDYTLYGETIPGGSWWLGSRVQDDDTWEEVKSGKLKGYSMFAVKLSEKKPQANRAYQMQEAPGGRKMNADEWDITMVALVDKPAVDKATYVIMRRAPDGKPIIAPAQKGTNEPREGDTSAMKKISRVATYHKDETPATDTKTEEGTSQTEAKAEETPPADKEEQAPETQESNDLAATIKAMFQEHMESFKEQVQAMIDTSLKPLKESFRTLGPGKPASLVQGLFQALQVTLRAMMTGTKARRPPPGSTTAPGPGPSRTTTLLLRQNPIRSREEKPMTTRHVLTRELLRRYGPDVAVYAILTGTLGDSRLQA